MFFSVTKNKRQVDALNEKIRRIYTDVKFGPSNHRFNPSAASFKRETQDALILGPLSPKTKCSITQVSI